MKKNEEETFFSCRNAVKRGKSSVKEKFLCEIKNDKEEKIEQKLAGKCNKKMKPFNLIKRRQIIILIITKWRKENFILL